MYIKIQKHNVHIIETKSNELSEKEKEGKKNFSLQQKLPWHKILIQTVAWAPQTPIRIGLFELIYSHKHLLDYLVELMKTTYFHNLSTIA